MMTLEKATKRKAEREAAKARGEGTSSKGEIPPPRRELVVTTSAAANKTVQPPLVKLVEGV